MSRVAAGDKSMMISPNPCSILAPPIRKSEDFASKVKRPSLDLALQLQPKLHRVPRTTLLPELDLSASISKEAKLPLSLVRSAPPLAERVKVEDQEDNWDEDFEEGISVSKIAGERISILIVGEPELMQSQCST